mgnify:CR=1 FL=1
MAEERRSTPAGVFRLALSELGLDAVVAGLVAVCGSTSFAPVLHEASRCRMAMTALISPL